MIQEQVAALRTLAVKMGGLMACEHLRELYNLCLSQKIRLGSSDLIHIVCRQCGHQDVCPTNLRDDRNDEEQDGATTSPSSNPIHVQPRIHSES